MPTEQKSDDNNLSQELNVTADIEEKELPKEVEERQVGAEISFIDEPTPLETFTGKQTDIVDQDGFVVTHNLPFQEGRDQNNFFVAVYQAYRPCELVAVSVYYQVKSSQGGAKFDVRIGNAGTDNTVNLVDLPLDSDAQISRSYKGDAELDRRYRGMVEGDYLVLQAVNTPTGILDLSITFHFKYSGRGETRYNT